APRESGSRQRLASMLAPARGLAKHARIIAEGLCSINYYLLELGVLRIDQPVILPYSQCGRDEQHAVLRLLGELITNLGKPGWSGSLPPISWQGAGFHAFATQAVRNICGG